MQLIGKMTLPFAALMLLPVPSMADGANRASHAGASGLSASPLCSTKPEAGRVQVAVLRPYVVARVAPSPEDILKTGEHYFVERPSPIWDFFKGGLCASQREENPKGFYARIVLSFGDGSQLLLSYPEARSKDEPILVKWDGGFYRMDSKAVRVLLDYSAPDTAMD